MLFIKNKMPKQNTIVIARFKYEDGQFYWKVASIPKVESCQYNKNIPNNITDLIRTYYFIETPTFIKYKNAYQYAYQVFKNRKCTILVKYDIVLPDINIDEAKQKLKTILLSINLT